MLFLEPQVALKFNASDPRYCCLKAADTCKVVKNKAATGAVYRRRGMALQVKNKGGTVEGSSLRNEVRGRIWGKVGGHKRPCMRM